MCILDIFVEENTNLYTVLYDFDERDSLTITHEELTDTEKLRDFFKQFKQDFESYYGKLNLTEAVTKTIEEADKPFNILLDLAANDSDGRLDELFKPLDDREDEETNYNYQQLKAYSDDPPWIRLYAVRYGDAYVFTGGAIKLTKRMKDRPHTKRELVKLQKVSEYLEGSGDKGVIGYIELE